MLVELHLLQNFAPSNLNRDDTGSPKDCEFGGVRRARISSQCLKRAIRTAFKDEGLIPPEYLAQRTKLAVGAIATELTRRGHDAAQARSVAEVALRAAGLGIEEEKTEYLLFLGATELTGVAELCDAHWRELIAALNASGASAKADGQPTSAKAQKQAAKEKLSKDISQALLVRLDGGKAADVALFGRMLADIHQLNVDAACQVAHAISTHKVSVEFDFYTAVDDLQPREESGAGMMGTVEFNSACFYRYANVDLDQLRTNLHGDDRLALQTLIAFLKASIQAVPTGKQNSMAAQNPPSLVMVVVRERGLWSLANAFARPVRATERADLITASIRALDDQWGKLTRMYGSEGIRGVWVAQEEGVPFEDLADAQTPSVSEVINHVREALAAGVPA